MHGKHRLGIARRVRRTLPLRRFCHAEGVLAPVALSMMERHFRPEDAAALESRERDIL